MLKIVIDTSPLSTEHGLRGVGFYTQRLIEAFSRIKNKEVEIKAIDFKKIDQSKLEEFSLLHYSSFDPFFLTLPLIKTKPTVVTVHDLIPLKFLNKFPHGIRGEIKWQVQKLSLEGANAIITDSISSKNDIIKFVNYDAHKIYPIYLAADEQFEKKLFSHSKKIAKKYHLPEKFILYVGDLNWNKNIPNLLRAFKELNREDLYLIIVGKAFLEKNLKERIEIAQLINTLKLNQKIKFLGFITTEDLVYVYNLALCYCQPSYYEGFGLPILEAMACGCPVVCSNNSSLAEIAGEAAFFIDPYKYKDVTKGLKKVLENKSIQQQLIKKGFIQAKKFSWLKTAKDTINVYKRVLNDN